MILGDSLSAAYGLLESEGWVKLLENQWHEQDYEIEVVNAAISGETTDGGLSRLPRLLKQHQPSHVFVELGGNDGLRGQSVKKMRANLREIVTLSQQAGATVLIQDMEIPTNYGKRYAAMFSDSYELIAEESDAHYLPFFLRTIALDSTLMQADGIHPNKTAQPIIAQYMFDTLTPLLLK